MNSTFARRAATAGISIMLAAGAVAATGPSAAAEVASRTDAETALIAQVRARPLVRDKAATGMQTSATTGTKPWRKGQFMVTTDRYKGIIPLGHAAMVWSRSSVIESLSKGVVWGENNWDRKRKEAFGATVRATTVNQDAKAADWTKKQLGKPYNYNFLNTSTRKKFYCSQLVWASFKDNFGINLDTSRWGKMIKPTELISDPGKVNVFWHKG